MTDDLLAMAVRIAREAGTILLDRFGGPARGVDTKSTSTDLVSDADREAERLITDAIHRRRPDDAVLGEEGAAAEGASGLRWVIDPLDGTVNFLLGVPHWCVSVACEDEHGGLVGVVHDPNRGETFAAARGRGATLNGAPVRVADRADVDRALIATGFAYDPEARRRQATELVRILPRVRDVRRFGSAALDLAWVACGRYDGYYEWSMGPWDKAAGIVLVTEAGGRTVPLPDPEPDADGILAAGPRIFEDLRKLVTEVVG